MCNGNASIAEHHYFSPPGRRKQSVAADWNDAEATHTRALTGNDLFDELHDVRDTLNAAAKLGDAELVGAIVIAVQRAYISRLADRAVFGDVCAGSMDATMACAEVLLQHKAQRRREGEQKNGLVLASIRARSEKF